MEESNRQNNLNVTHSQKALPINSGMENNSQWTSELWNIQMSNILTSISFSTPDLDKASGPKLYRKLSSNISSTDLTRKASLSQYECASCRPVSTSCRPVSNERSNRLWTRVHSPTSNQKYWIVLQFYGLIYCKYCQIHYFSAPGACKILDLSIVEYCSRPPLALFTSI